MKKILLFTFAIGVATFAVAQKQKGASSAILNQPGWQKAITTEAPGTNNGPVKPTSNASAKRGGTVEKFLINSSKNSYGVIYEDANCLSSEPKSQALMFMHRGGGDYNPGLTGDIYVSKSFDKGISWDSVKVLTGINRYPTGGIHNQNATTNPAETYGVFASPTLSSSNVFDKTSYGTMKLSGTPLSVESVSHNETNPDKVDYNMYKDFYVSGNGIAHVCADLMKFNSSDKFVQYYGLKIATGVFNPNTEKFDWHLDSLNIPIKAAGTSTEPLFQRSKMVWSEDGQTGYVYAIGVDSLLDDNSLQPIIYKTTNGGETWAKQERVDFRQFPTIYDSLVPMHGLSEAAPSFTSANDATVDSLGYLHIVAEITSHWSLHPDSVFYGFVFGTTKTPEYRGVYHLWESANGWNAELIHTNLAGYVSKETSGYGEASTTSQIGWGSRLQVSRNAAGADIFAVWTDTDPNLDVYNKAPDLYGWGYSLRTGKQTAIKNFTLGTDYESDNFFHFVATKTFETDTNYAIPVVTVARTSALSLDPVNYYYVSGISFSKSELEEKSTSINNYNRNNAIVSQCYPNPSNGLSNVDINLTNSANVSIVVTNLMGQVVNQMNLGQLNSGKNVAKINTSSLNSGVYFYTVNINNDSYVNKMIVK